MENPFIYEPEKPKRRFFSDILEALVIAITFNVVVYFLFIIPSQVDGPSMIPTLNDKELLFANKTTTWFNDNPTLLQQLNWDYQRGDIVIFDFENIVLVKRVIAKEGDTIMIKDGDVYVNDKKLTEDYLATGIKTYLPQNGAANLENGVAKTVPAGEFFVMGDNRVNSKDSRFSEVGFIPRNRIKGVVFFRFWPLNRFGIISRGQFQEQ
jgi:signal peptidase I